MNEIKLSEGMKKEDIFHKVEEYLISQGFRISKVDKTRPWGGFFVIDETQIVEFKEKYFESITLSEDQLKQKLSPKILLVAPEARLSWQYHHRRAELWTLISGESGIVRSHTDEQGEAADMELGVVVSLAQGERHRLVGKSVWGIVAEIWIHVDPTSPSNEEDIVRLDDDYSRK